MANPSIYSLIDRAVSEYSMILDGDRILLAISGGKDSTVMAEYFYARKKRRDANFELSAFHVATSISPPISKEIKEKLSEWQIPLIIKEIDILGRLKEGKSMNCWFCSSMRRLELSFMAQQLGFNKIALGHHLDDILETLLMNMLGKKSLFTMPPILKFQKFPITFIRPLCLCDTSMIVKHAKDRGYLCSTCTCTYQENSARKEARKRLSALTSDSYKLKRNIFESLKHVNTEYLP